MYLSRTAVGVQEVVERAEGGRGRAEVGIVESWELFGAGLATLRPRNANAIRFVARTDDGVRHTPDEFLASRQAIWQIAERQPRSAEHLIGSETRRWPLFECQRMRLADVEPRLPIWGALVVSSAVVERGDVSSRGTREAVDRQQ